MKLTEKYIVFRNKETGAYLVDYKNEVTLEKLNTQRQWILKHSRNKEKK